MRVVRIEHTVGPVDVTGVERSDVSEREAVLSQFPDKDLSDV